MNRRGRKCGLVRRMLDDDAVPLDERLGPHFASIGDTIARAQTRIVAATSLLRQYLTVVEMTALQVERSKRCLSQFQPE